MPTCLNCSKDFPYKTIIDGKEVFLNKRKYCLKCNPIGERLFWGGKKVVKTEERILKRTDHTCSKCGKKYSHKTRNKVCTTCRNKEKRHSQREKAVNLLGGECILCGYHKCIDSLDFHHVNGIEKKFALSSSWMKPWKEIEEEIKKCVLLCRNCHGEVHAGVTKLPT